MPAEISGGTRLYVSAQKGLMPMLAKDMTKLDHSTVRLWNGSEWTTVGEWLMSAPVLDRHLKSRRAAQARFRGKSPSVAGDMEIELANGEKIGIPREAPLLIARGLVCAKDLHVGDCLLSVVNPPPYDPICPKFIEDEMGWFIGLYLAEGSYTDGYIEISGNKKETESRMQKIEPIVRSFHGTLTTVTPKNNQSDYIRIRSTALKGVLDIYLGGETSKDKYVTVKTWQRSNTFLKRIAEGYLEGDGHYEESARRWKLDFCDNRNIVNALRLIASRLNWSVRLKPYKRETELNGVSSMKSGYRGSLVTNKDQRRSSDTEIIGLSQSGARKFWNIDVSSRISLASGVLIGA